MSALDAGADDGRVIQHLTGGPELLAAYREGSLFTPIEHALITAALDARRLGYSDPIPAETLAVAADGDLSSRDRPSDLAAFTTALDELAHGYRGEDRRSRNNIRRTLRALTRRRPITGAPAAFEPDDYLLQYALRKRCYQIPPDSFWAALVRTDSTRIGMIDYAAWAHGLVRHAAQLRKHPVAHGDAIAAFDLLAQMQALHPTDNQPVVWTTTLPALNRSFFWRHAIEEVDRDGGEQQVTILAGHSHAMDEFWHPTGLLRAWLLWRLARALLVK